MTTREKDKYTREAVKARIQELKEFFAAYVISSIGKDISLNTQDMHQKVGEYKGLKNVLYE